ncbi:MAG: hypothetical protein KMY50_05100, partial [Candidatus Desulforudis sp.]|nr:hypothetical protein [Desulforudis sp.]
TLDGCILAAISGGHLVPCSRTKHLLLDGLRDRSRAIRVDELKIGEGSEELPQIKADIKAKAFSRQ